MYRTLLMLIIVLMLLSCEKPAEKTNSVLTEARPEAGGFSSSRLARLDSAMNDWVKKEWVNGAVALIARKGKIVFHKSFGYNDLDNKTPLDRNGIFRIASQTKAITTVAAMMLWEEGKFALDDPVSKFIPSFANQQVLDKFNPGDTTYTTVPSRRPITIRDLLTHTSGIGYPTIGTAEATAMYRKNGLTVGLNEKEHTLGDDMARLGKLPLLFQPGEKWMYGVNTDLLGYLVEVWSGMTLEEFFTRRIFEPLNMNDTYFNVPEEKASRVVNFFIGDSTGIKKEDLAFGVLDMSYPVQEKTYFSGGGGLSSTTMDYAVFLQMLLNNGVYNGVRLLSRNTVRMMTMNQIGDLFVGENKFGFGFSIVTEYASRSTPSQVGTYSWGGAFSTSYFVDPKEEMILVLYRQMWGPNIDATNKMFRPLVYQAIND